MTSIRVILILSALAFVHCVSTRSSIQSHPTSSYVFRECFSDATAIQNQWFAVVPKIAEASAEIEDAALQLKMPPNAEGDIVFRHRLDVSDLGGKRVRLTTRIKADVASEDESAAFAMLTVTPSQAQPSYSDYAGTRSVTTQAWTEVRAVIDVAPAAAAAEISLILHGPGRAWFDDVAVQIVGDSPEPAALQLSSQQLNNVATLARSAAMIRFLHPSDQAAELDWNNFLPAAIDRVLRVTDTHALVHELRALFAPIAPTATFVTGASTEPQPASLQDAGDHLIRWWHIGLGPGTYVSYREDRSPDELVEITESAVAQIARPGECKSIRVRATAQRLNGAGTAVIFAQLLRSGQQRDDAAEPIVVNAKEIILAKEVPPDTQQIRVGLRIEGRASVTLESLAVACENGDSATIALKPDLWTARGWPYLYTWSIDQCARGVCATLSPKPYDTTFVPQRDLLETDVGSGIRIRLPTAVWTDAKRTLPIPSERPSMGDFAIRDLPTRLATVVATWGTLSIFYPYFRDQHIAWLSSLSPALNEAAAADSPAAIHASIDHLLVSLHDNHVRVSHPAIDTTGLLPLAFRRFDNAIIVTGGLPEHTKIIPPGAEILSFDDVPALEVYNQLEKRVSAATDAWRANFTALSVGFGPLGRFRRVRARLTDNTIVERLLPFVARDLYKRSIQSHREKTGIEVAPGVYYVDLDGLSVAGWTALLPTLRHARSIVLDLRGIVGSGALVSLAHFTDRLLLSPRLEIPLVGKPGVQQPPTQWSIRPAQPRLNVPLVVLCDGQSMSTDETFLQIFHDNRLGAIVGEPSGGTNGNVNTFSVPGGFTVRFTGMRVAGSDGTTIQGHGIVPDQVVHPTLEGVRGGRDEILEAGIAAAQRLAPK